MRQFKMQISTQTVIKTSVKNISFNENCILKKIGLKLQNPTFNSLCKIAFWNKQKWLNKLLIIWTGDAQVKEQHSEPACIHHPQLAP